MSVDPNRPSAARIYDCFLGGTHNFAVDREVAARAIELVPELPKIMRANRAFLQRVVRFAAARGVRQFLDIGSGIPTEANVHEVAREATDDPRIVYVDVEPTAVIHARQILGDNPTAVVLHGDLLQPDRILDDPQVRRILDLDQPVCLLMVALLHFIPETPALHDAMRRYHKALAPGSILAVSHATGGDRPGEVNSITDLYNRTGTPLVLRSREQLMPLFAGWDLVEPGLTYSPVWRPDPTDPTVENPESFLTLVGVGVHP